MIMMRTYRPPRVSGEIRNILRWCYWLNGDSIGKQVEKALVSFLQSQIDQITANNNAPTVIKEANEFRKWLTSKEKQLYGAP